MANASSESRLPYFRGKGQVEEMRKDTGIPYAIIRPTLVFGEGDLLLNNMAWALRLLPRLRARRLPVQPIYAGDLAAQAVDAGSGRDSFVADATGPETLSFEELLRLLDSAVGARVRLMHTPPSLGFRPDPAGRPVAAVCGANPGRSRRPDGRVADVQRQPCEENQVR